MYPAGDQLLARARFACDENSHVRRRDALDHFEDAPHGGRIADDVRQTEALMHEPPQARQLRHLLAKGERLLHRQTYLIAVERLGDEVERSGAHRFDRRFDIAIGCDHDDRNAVVDGAGAPQKLESR